MSVSLQLNKYFFTKIRVEAHPPPSGEEAGKVENNAKSDIMIELHQPEENKDLYQVTFSVDISPVDKESSTPYIPYTASAEAVGFFVIPGENKLTPEIEKLLKITGGSILYGAIREQILTLTSRGPFNPMQLPTINLVRIVENSLNKKKQEEQQKCD